MELPAVIILGLGADPLIDDSYDGRIFHITAQTPGILSVPSGNYFWELDFVPTGAETTRIELRSLETVWGTPQAPKELWISVQNCG